MKMVLVRPKWQIPQLDADNRWVGGVCAALAVEVGVEPRITRAAFVIVALTGGWGVLAYAIAWLVLLRAQTWRIRPYHPEPKGASSFHRHMAVGLIVIAVVLLVRSLNFGYFDFLDAFIGPIGLAVAGGLVAWTRRGNEEGGLVPLVRIVVGVAVAIAGVLVFVASFFTNTVALILSALVLVVLVVVALIIAPTLVNLSRSFDAERLERIRSEERTQMAVHLHDSVLQTLSLIQRQAHDSSQVVNLARQQERELRSWLYGPKPSTPGTVRIGAAIDAAAAEVEARHGVPIDVVTVGDADGFAPGHLRDLVAAAREAMVNAAKHSQADKVDVYVERTPTNLEVYVRDTGVGFDPALVPDDRRGVADSILGRMKRRGGSALVDTSLGQGTEIELRLPVRLASDLEQRPATDQM